MPCSLAAVIPILSRAQVRAYDAHAIETRRICVARDGNQLAVISTTCTHLGCTPNWLSAERKFKCPCHGSGFYMDGLNFEGPAPRPMDRVKITLSPEGVLLVDKSIVYVMRPGEAPDEQYPESLLEA